MANEQTILITGADGTIGSMLRQALRRPGRHLRLLDLMTQAELDGDEDAELIVGSFLDPDLMREACANVDVVIHLGGLATSGYTWNEYLDVNIDGTYVVLEAARQARVPRVIYASSNHAVGYYSLSEVSPVPDNLPARPDSLYGISKAASESLCSYFHDRYGLDAICLRIGTFRDRPPDRRSLWSWLSPGDCARLFEAAIAAPSPGFRLVWGVSANTSAAVSLAEARALGYEPVDDAQDYVAELDAADDSATFDLIGGSYTLTLD